MLVSMGDPGYLPMPTLRLRKGSEKLCNEIEQHQMKQKFSPVSIT
jgi:hypothetical protein